MNRRLVVLVSSLILVCVAGQARAGSLDPFGHAAGPTLRLDPFRKLAADSNLATATDPAPQTAPAQTTTASASPAPQSCQKDEDCMAPSCGPCSPGSVLLQNSRACAVNPCPGVTVGCSAQKVCVVM